MSQIEFIDLREDRAVSHCQADVDRYADLIVEFMADRRPSPEAMNVPFGNQPVNVWVSNRDLSPERVVWNVRLDGLKRKSHSWLPILRRLWQLAMPLGVEVEEEAFDEICAGGLPGRSNALSHVTIPLRANRFVTARSVCDTMLMDNVAVATMLGSVVTLADRLRLQVIDAAYGRVSSPAATPTDQMILIRTEPKVGFKQEAFMFEMFHYIAAAGVIYDPDPNVPPPVPFTAIPPLPPLPEPPAMTLPLPLPTEAFIAPPPPAPRLLDLS